MASNPRGKELLGQAKGILQASLDILDEIGQQESQTSETTSNRLPVGANRLPVTISSNRSISSGDLELTGTSRQTRECASQEFR